MIDSGHSVFCVNDHLKVDHFRQVVSSGRRNEIVVGGRIVYSSNPKGSWSSPEVVGAAEVHGAAE